MYNKADKLQCQGTSNMFKYEMEFRNEDSITLDWRKGVDCDGFERRKGARLMRW